MTLGKSGVVLFIYGKAVRHQHLTPGDIEKGNIAYSHYMELDIT